MRKLDGLLERLDENAPRLGKVARNVIKFVRQKVWRKKTIIWAIVILLIVMPINCLHPACRRVSLNDIRWNSPPVEIEITFDGDTPIIIEGQHFHHLRGRLNSVFSRNREMLRTRGQPGDFRVRFRYDIRIFYALFIPVVDDWGGTATFWVDPALQDEVERMVRISR